MSKMNVLAINSSPRGGGKSKTQWMLDHLVAGMRDAGADVEVIHLRKKKIKYCIGCFTCWSKTPGACVHKDDMSQELLAKLIASDVAVYATPLYYHTVNAQMKTFLERTLPIEEPFVEKADGDRPRHPYRLAPPKAVWLSVAGMPQLEAFDTLSHYIRHVFDDRLLAEIYRPAAESLMHPGKEAIRDTVAQAVRQAGVEIVERQAVSDAVMAQIRQPVFESFDAFAGNVNMFWKACIAEGATPEEFVAKMMHAAKQNEE